MATLPPLRAVIVGAGPAGARCADHLAAGGAQVTLIGAEPDHPYNRVALSSLLAGDLGEAQLITHPAEALTRSGIAWRPGARVERIDRAGRAAVLGTGERVPYDALVLATGANAVRLTLPGAESPHVVLYRTLAEVRRMLAQAACGGAAVVIGGGLLGLEAAAGLARRGMAVTVLHAVDRLMERQLDHGAAGLLKRRLEDMGITVLPEAKTAAIEADHVALADGQRIRADLVVMAVGIRPNVELARGAGLAVNRGAVVDDAMRTEDAAIWAIGECAEHRGQTVGLVAPCFAQAEVAAASILGRPACYTPAADAAALKVAGAAVWSAGEIEGADALILDDAEGGLYRRLVLREGRLTGAVLYGETADAPWYLDLIKQGRPVGAARDLLLFGPAFQPEFRAAA